MSQRLLSQRRLILSQRLLKLLSQLQMMHKLLSNDALRSVNHFPRGLPAQILNGRILIVKIGNRILPVLMTVDCFMAFVLFTAS